MCKYLKKLLPQDKSKHIEAQRKFAINCPSFFGHTFKPNIEVRALKYLASVVRSVKSAWRVSAASMWPPGK